jgi:hypothetical protein
LCWKQIDRTRIRIAVVGTHLSTTQQMREYFVAREKSASGVLEIIVYQKSVASL